MEKSTQALVAALIYGAISLLMQAGAVAGWYGVFQPGSAPGLVPVAALFTCFAIGAAFAAVLAARSK